MSRQAYERDTIMADANAATAPGLPDHEQKLLAAFRRAEDPVKMEACAILGIEWGGCPPQPTLTKGKRKHASDQDADSIVKRARPCLTPPVTEPVNFRTIRNPQGPVCCLIQVNQGELAGSLNTRNGGYGVWLFLNGGKGRSPSIGLQFKRPGSDGREVGRVNWHVDSRAEDRWVIQDLHYILAAEAPHDRAVYNKTAIEQCEGDESLGRLICITLKLTSHAGGSCQWPPKESSQAIRTCINAIFFSRKDYTVRIWFIIPWPNSADLDRNCLSVMRYLFEQRKEPLSLAQDTNGVHFAHLATDAKQGISRAVAGLGMTTQASQGREEPQGVSVKPEPTVVSIWDTPAPDQKAKAVKPTSTTDEGQLEDHQGSFADRTVPSFASSLPVIPTNPDAQSTRGTESRAIAGTSASSRTQDGADGNLSDKVFPVATQSSRLGNKAPFTAGSAAEPSLTKQPISVEEEQEEDGDEDEEFEEEKEHAITASPSIAGESDPTAMPRGALSRDSREASLARQANLQLAGSLDARSTDEDGDEDKDGDEDESSSSARPIDDLFRGLTAATILQPGNPAIDEDEQARLRRWVYGR